MKNHSGNKKQDIPADQQIQIAAIDRRTIAPDPGGVGHTISSIGYKLEEALADFIDNSIDAKAREVVIRFQRDQSSIRRILVSDNGQGIDPARLDAVMQFGARLKHSEADLGKYGMGLKSAAFSQGKSMSLLVRAGGKFGGRRWTRDSIEAGWYCDVLDPDGVAKLFEMQWIDWKAKDTGTIVLLDDLDRLRQHEDGIEATMDSFHAVIPKHLGLIFHKFLSAKQLRIRLDSHNTSTNEFGLPVTVEPLDPFGYVESGKQGYPRTFSAKINKNESLKLECHIWPPKSTDSGYKLGGGRVAARQGFYFYRNDRLIQAGGWNGWRNNDTEPHLSLARVRIDIPARYDSLFRLKVQKSGVELPPQFINSLNETGQSGGASLASYVQEAQEVYRQSKKKGRSSAVILGSGVQPKLRRAVNEPLAEYSKSSPKIAIRWKILPEGTFLVIDRDSQEILLNRNYRKKVVDRHNASDGSPIKVLLFLLLRDEFKRKRASKSSDAMLKSLNDILLSALEEH